MDNVDSTTDLDEEVRRKFMEIEVGQIYQNKESPSISFEIFSIQTRSCELGGDDFQEIYGMWRNKTSNYGMCYHLDEFINKYQLVYLHQVEQGREIPTEDTIRKMAIVLEYPIEKLLPLFPAINYSIQKESKDDTQILLHEILKKIKMIERKLSASNWKRN